MSTLGEIMVGEEGVSDFKVGGGRGCQGWGGKRRGGPPCQPTGAYGGEGGVRLTGGGRREGVRVGRASGEEHYRVSLGGRSTAGLGPAWHRCPAPISAGMP